MGESVSGGEGIEEKKKRGRTHGQEQQCGDYVGKDGSRWKRL